MKDTLLDIGERVVRANSFPGEPQRMGMVTARYTPHKSHQPVTEPLTLYSVQWDDTGLEEHGYFRSGLDRVIILPPIMIPGVR